MPNRDDAEPARDVPYVAHTRRRLRPLFLTRWRIFGRAARGGLPFAESGFDSVG